MSGLIRQLEELVLEEFTDEEGPYRAKLLPGLRPEELTALAAQVPTGTLPPEIVALLLYSKGVDFGWLQEIRFDAFSDFGRLGLFPACIELASDGTGNYWVLDINSVGQWGAVFYVCHDPQVIVRQTDNLSNFLGQIQEYGRFKSDSRFDEVYERLSCRIWKEREVHTGLVGAATAAASVDTVMSQFAAQQPPEFLIADLRAESATQGFSHHKFFRSTDLQVRKHKMEPIWAFEPPSPSWFSQLFGK
ncbi:MAG: SMI1/KNR4 family protein [Janthinobacterium lividum]